jgi:hypothetical protein
MAESVSHILIITHFSKWFIALAAFEIGIFIPLAIFLYRKLRFRPSSNPVNLKRPYRGDQIKNVVFLVGDMGALPKDHDPPIVLALKSQIRECEKHSAVVFLGDNVYPKGMPAEGDPERPRAEQRLVSQLKIVEGFAGKTIFISGNHDWNKGKKGGWEYAVREEEFVEKYLGRDDVFLPHNGCPGPDCVTLDKDIEILIVNTQWWVQKGFVPLGSEYGCKAKSEDDFFRLLKECLDSNKGKRLLVLGHHPLYSNSAHGGKFSTRQHLFPFTAVNKRLMIPVPLLGSIYPLYRKFFGPKEDMSYPGYRRMRKKLLSLFRHYRGLIYASGHDHNLQYIQRRQQHYLVSGSGSKTAYVRQGGHAIYTGAVQGFMRLNYLDNGQIWLEVWQASAARTGLVFTSRII